MKSSQVLVVVGTLNKTTGAINGVEAVAWITCVDDRRHITPVKQLDAKASGKSCTYPPGERRGRGLNAGNDTLAEEELTQIQVQTAALVKLNRREHGH